MRWHVMIGLLVLLAAAPSRANELTQAVHAAHATWLLRESGQISRLDDGSTSPVSMESPGHPVALCRLQKVLMLVSNGEAAWQLFRRRSENWLRTASTPVLPDERFVGAACGTAGITVLTTKRLLDQQRGSIPLVNYQLPMISIRTVVYRDANSLLVGTNAGEWGGELLRIDIATGVVEKVAGVGGPIHDIAPAPGKPNCVLLAIGLVHFLPSGRLTELCGDQSKRLYVRAWQSPGSNVSIDGPGKDPYPSVAFYGFAPTTGGNLRAIGMDGMYRITTDGAVTGPEPFPPFVTHGDVSTAKIAADLDLALTGINRRASLGGAMPIAVPR